MTNSLIKEILSNVVKKECQRCLVFTKKSQKDKDMEFLNIFRGYMKRKDDQE